MVYIKGECCISFLSTQFPLWRFEIEASRDRDQVNVITILVVYTGAKSEK